MKMQVINKNNIKSAKILLIPVFEDKINETLSFNTDIASKLIEATKEHNFMGKKDECLKLNSFLGYKKIVLLGCGNSTEAKDNDLLNVGGICYNLLGKNEDEATFDFSAITDVELLKKVSLNILLGFKLKNWDFKKYFTKNLENTKTVQNINIITDISDLKQELIYVNAVAEGSYLTKNLITEPANVMYSETFVKEIKELEKLGLEIEILGEKELQKLGMGALLSVNQASTHEAVVAIMKWNNGGDDAPIAFVGKGVTFDSGGLSLKPGSGMMEMKRDMSGAATVVGLMKTLALRNAKVNAVGLVGLVENVVSGNATRPGDVVKSMSGKTIEILNTDAEGRLVLADVLHYANTTYKPKFIVDIATLTGAIIISLGRSRAGLFSNNNELINKLLDSGEQSGEKLWSLPVEDEYRSYLKSDIADICNITTGGYVGQAGSTTAAVFLKEFVGDTNWAHLDIAGTAWLNSETPVCKKGATAFGLRLLNTLVYKYYEKH